MTGLRVLRMIASLCIGAAYGQWLSRRVRSNPGLHWWQVLVRYIAGTVAMGVTYGFALVALDLT